MPSMYELSQFRANKASEHQYREPFDAPEIKHLFATAKGIRLFILPSAKAKLAQLPTWERTNILKRIGQLAGNGFAPADGLRNKVAPEYMRVLHVNYFLDYVYDNGEITIEGISLDPASSMNAREQQQALYHVKKQMHVEVGQGMSKEDQIDLPAAWERIDKTDGFVHTQHAAVNGMLNDLDKATWLMGAHVQVGFANDAAQEYTLFHNPTRGFSSDLWDCISDKFGFSTAEAQHLADVLWDNQQNRRAVKWVVHSQGGLIFAEALRLHLKHRGGALNYNSVIFHGNANNAWRTNTLLKHAQITRLAPDRANDYDFVHQVLGLNGNLFQMMGSTVHAPKLKGSDADQTYSVHTLPNVSQETWNRKHALLKSHSMKFAHPFKRTGS
jgi:hypothetical protein